MGCKREAARHAHPDVEVPGRCAWPTNSFTPADGRCRLSARRCIFRGLRPFCTRRAAWCFRWVNSCNGPARRCVNTGAVQIWPGTPVAQALIENGKVAGVRLLDQGVSRQGAPAEGFTPGLDVHAALTVVGDGPVGPIGRQLDDLFGWPEKHHARDWAVGMKFVVDLPQGTPLQPGTVLHTFGYPEPEIFGFFYVHPDPAASLGIFVPSWFDSPVRTAYRYLQHWMMHPYLWDSKGAKLRSWGAKTLGESGRRGEPRLAGDGYARIGEGSGSTNVLTGSGVDEAGPPARNWPKRSSNCSRRKSLSPRRISKRLTSNAAAGAGWNGKPAPPKNRATAFNAASSPGCSAWPWPV